MNRESWLTEMASRLESLYFNSNNITLDSHKVTCGFPHTGATAARRKRIGECHPASNSEGDYFEMFISPVVSDSIEVAAILAHEMCHVADRCMHGHKSPFVRFMKMCELEGKPTATQPSEAFKHSVAPIIQELGEYPHAKMNVKNSKKKGSRMVKCECSDCGYILRTSRTNLNIAIPICPDQDCFNFQQQMKVEV
jgi:hypothetical protein